MLHEDQIHIDADIARSMIAEQFPVYRHEPIEPLRGAGTDHAIFRIGTSVAARFPLRPEDASACAERLRGEAAAMSEFARHSPFPAPRPIGLGRPGPRYPLPWSLQSWIDGTVATPDGVSASAVFARDLARLIAALRAAETQGRRFDGAGRGGHLPDHDPWIETCFKESAGLLDVPRLREMWARLRDLPRSGPDVMCHKDLIPANLLVGGEHLVGVLDAGKFGAADAALDLVAGWHLLDRERRAILRDRLGSGPVEWKRGAA